MASEPTSPSGPSSLESIDELALEHPRGPGHICPPTRPALQTMSSSAPLTPPPSQGLLGRIFDHQSQPTPEPSLRPDAQQTQISLVQDELEMKTETLGADFETFLKTANFNVLIISLTEELNKPKPSCNKCLEMVKALKEKRDAEPAIGQLKADDDADNKVEGVEASGQQKRKRDVTDDGTPGQAAVGQSQTKKSKKKYKEKTSGDAEDGGEGGDQKDHGRTEPGVNSQLEAATGAMDSAKVPVFDSESDDEGPESDEEAAGEIKNESPKENKSLGPEDRTPKEIYQMSYTSIIKLLRTLMEKNGLGAYTKYLDCITKKYTEARNPKTKEKPEKPFQGAFYRTQKEVEERFGKKADGDKVTIQDEERAHPWCQPPHSMPLFNGPLMRAWYTDSKGILRHGIAWLARGLHIPLTTAEKRKDFLGRHAYWGSRARTPFISFTDALYVIDMIIHTIIPKELLRNGVPEKDCDVKITMINPNVRIAAGYTILKMKEELDYYKVQPKCGWLERGGISFFEKEYLIPYYSNIEEVIGTWYWRDILQWMKKYWASSAGGSHSKCQFGNHDQECRLAALRAWYKAVAFPKWEAHEKARLAGTKCVIGKSGCIDASNGSCVCNSN